ncbi:ilys-4 [Pristionchus pacificus]|uniref:lysozyme n=1 Tax=Pristionchus pacificus TaxID=54126 RepID=A0A2A6BDQ8_PRIPA|nr:ilys-4 [Pristionchus pacificus]|eukprot:PDM64035.1 ilys-4 [Pristionchus pacificus]
MALNRVRSFSFIFCLLFPCLQSLLLYERVNTEPGCLRSMCQIDSGCVPHGCDLDVHGRIGCGYFRLNIQQFRQCYQPGKKEDEEEELAWINCSMDYECSSNCIKTLGFRYKVKCYGKSDCEAIARIHDGGANGCRDRNTAYYWKQVKASCGDSCNAKLQKKQ